MLRVFLSDGRLGELICFDLQQCKMIYILLTELSPGKDLHYISSASGLCKFIFRQMFKHKVKNYIFQNGK